MTNRQAYNQLLLEKECIKNRPTCSKDCTNCNLHLDLITINSSLDFVLSILKSREPELYFCNDIELLKGLIQYED